MKNVCWVDGLMDCGRKLIHFVWCWSFHMKILSEEYVNKLLLPCCIVMTVTWSSDIQQWHVSSGILCCIVTGCLMTILRKVEFLFFDPWNLEHQETLTQWHVTSEKTWILNSTAVRTQTSQGTSLLYTNTANRGFMKCGSWKFVARMCRTLYRCAVITMCRILSLLHSGVMCAYTYVKFFNPVFAQRSESIFNVKCLFASRTNEISSNKNIKKLKKHKETIVYF